MTLKTISIAAIQYFLLVVCNNNVSILHCFWDIATFMVYVTAYDLEKSCRFDKTVEITSNMHVLIHG